MTVWVVWVLGMVNFFVVSTTAAVVSVRIAADLPFVLIIARRHTARNAVVLKFARMGARRPSVRSVVEARFVCISARRRTVRSVAEARFANIVVNVTSVRSAVLTSASTTRRRLSARIVVLSLVNVAAKHVLEPLTVLLPPRYPSIPTLSPSTLCPAS